MFVCSKLATDRPNWWLGIPRWLCLIKVLFLLQPWLCLELHSRPWRLLDHCHRLHLLHLLILQPLRLDLLLHILLLPHPLLLHLLIHLLPPLLFIISLPSIDQILLYHVFPLLLVFLLLLFIMKCFLYFHLTSFKLFFGSAFFIELLLFLKFFLPFLLIYLYLQITLINFLFVFLTHKLCCINFIELVVGTSVALVVLMQVLFLLRLIHFVMLLAGTLVSVIWFKTALG